MENVSKGKEKGKKTTMVKKFKEKPTCSHCGKKGHEEDKCWKLHPEFLPKKFQNKEEQKTAATVQQDLGSDSGDETMIVSMGIKGISFLVQVLLFNLLSLKMMIRNEMNFSM
jgi:hypothetical protein